MLKVWFPGTNDTEDYGLGGTQWINDNVVIADDGKLGKCLSFNGSNSRLSTTNFELSNNWSFACWAKDDSSVTNWRLLIMLNTTGSDADTQMSFWLHTGEKRFEVCANGKYVSTVKYVPGQWNHFAATYDGSQILVYLNGVKVYTLANTNEQLARHNLTIGARGTNANGGHEGATSYFYGLVNDLRIWDNQVISPREIKELSKGLVLHYPLAMPGGENILPNTWAGERTFEYPSSSFSDRWSCVTSIVPTASQYTLSFWAKSTVAGDQIRTHFYSPNTTTTCVSSQGITKTASDGNMNFTLSTSWQHYWVVYSQTETTAVKHVICPRMGAVGNTYGICYGTGVVSIKGIKLEEGSTPTPWIPNPADTAYTALGFNDGIEYDVSGFQYNGEKYGNLKWSNNSAKYNTCYEFDGSSDYVRLKQDLYSQFRLARDEVTVNIWAYKDDWDDYKNSGSTAQWMTMCGCQEGGGFSIYEVGNGRFTFVCGTGASSNSYEVSNTATGYADSLSAGWHMFTLTFDGLSLKGYVDGNLVVSNAFFTTKTPIYYNTGTTSIYIGVESGSGKQAGLWWKGKLSDFRVYTTALSAEDILELYHTPITLANNGALMTQGEFEES